MRLKILSKEDIINSEIEKCYKSVWYFAVNYVKTLHKVEGTIAFPEWKYLKEYFELLEKHNLLLVLKSRQMFITWATISYALWESIFKGAGEILFISKREQEAFELIYRTKFIYDNLPKWLKPEIGTDNKREISFNKLKSRIFSIPNNPAAVRTYSPRRVIWDEMPHTPFDGEIWNAVLPVIEKDGKFVGIGTPNGPYTQHAILWLDKNNDFVKLPIRYTLHPDKNEEWKAKQKALYSREVWNREQELDISAGTELIYKDFAPENISNVLDDYSLYPIYRTMDFGFHTPVCIWAYLKDGMLIPFAEWYGEDNTIEQMAFQVLAIDEQLHITENEITMTYGDPAGEAVTDEGLSAVDKIRKVIPDFKFSSRKSNILPGVDTVRSKVKDANNDVWLKIYKSGNPLHISIYDKGCPRLITDIQNYRKCEKSELPFKDGITDHGNDALRYLCIGIYGTITELDVNSLLTAKVVGVRQCLIG